MVLLYLKCWTSPNIVFTISPGRMFMSDFVGLGPLAASANDRLVGIGGKEPLKCKGFP